MPASLLFGESPSFSCGAEGVWHTVRHDPCRLVVRQVKEIPWLELQRTLRRGHLITVIPASQKASTPAGVPAISRGLSEATPPDMRSPIGADPGGVAAALPARTAPHFGQPYQRRFTMTYQRVVFHALLAPLPGCDPIFLSDRGCRFAQPPANRCDPCRGRNQIHDSKVRCRTRTASVRA
jgi:hypothetical protein